jgi:hypothetical protein
MRYLLFFMFLVGIFVIGKRAFVFNPFHSVSGKGPVKTEVRDVSGFHAVESNIAGDIEVSVADNYYVEVQAQENLLPILKTELDGGTLKIYFEESVSYSGTLKIRISAPAFDRFSLGGSGKMSVLTPIKAEKMRLEVAGSGDIFLQQVEFDQVFSSIAGSGSVTLDGKANRMESDIAGSGDVHAKKLTANQLDVEISGSGSVSCNVVQDLKASIAGSGDVYYSGQPAVETNVSGSGSVKKISEQ